MAFVDTHAHLYDEKLLFRLPAVLKDGENAGLERVICVSETIKDARMILDISKEHPIVSLAAGLHPVSVVVEKVERDVEEMVLFIREHEQDIVAVGEVGLDFSRHIVGESKELREAQRYAFRKHIGIAKELDLPLSVHSRSAGHHALDVLREMKDGPRFVMHAFDGRAQYALVGCFFFFHKDEREQAQNALRDFGGKCMFSFPPSIARSNQLKKLAKLVPLDAMLLESDAPALGPVSGKEVNVPRNIRVAIQEIAKIREEEEGIIAEQTTRNAKSMFSKAFLE